MARKKAKEITTEPSLRFCKFTDWMAANEDFLDGLDTRGVRKLSRWWDCNDLMPHTLDKALDIALFQWKAYRDEGVTKPRW